MVSSASPAHPVIAVVGAGAAGVLTTISLLRDPRLAHASIRLLDPRDSTGRGVAYGTTDPRHLLNVAVARMSADPDDPDDFLRWLHRHHGAHASVTDFVPRMWFGEYLESSLARASTGGNLYRITDSVHQIRPAGDRFRVRLRHGLSFLADAVVLALGEPAADLAWLPPQVRQHPKFVSDPWAPAQHHRATADADRVLILGTGLSMVDQTLTLDAPGRRLLAVSRSGLLPAVHATTPPPGILPPPVLPARHLTADEVRGIVVRQVHLAHTEFGDWRAGIDSLRPVTDELWSRMPLPEQRRALAEQLREWEVRRHRMAPAAGRELQQIVSSGRLTVRAGGVAGLAVRGNGFRVRLADGSTGDVDAIVACTGAGVPARVHGAGNPLVAALVADGTARLNVSGLGLDTVADGRLVDLRGRVWPRAWVVGGYRRGPIWETTAIPQIRAQAAAVARAVAGELLAQPVASLR